MNDLSGTLPDFPERLPDPARGGAVVPAGRALQPVGDRPLDFETLDDDGAGSFNLRDVWRLLFRWRWLILATTAAAVLLALGMTLATTPLYRAYLSLEIAEPQAQLTPGRNGADGVAVRDMQYLPTQYGLLRSRALADRVVRQLNLANDPTIAPSTLSREVRQKIAANAVAGGLSVEPVTGSRLINLSVVDKNPVRAAAIANAYADAFIASQLERKFGATAYARNFLQNRLASTKKALETSEAALVNYAQQQNIVEVAGAGGGGSGTGGGTDGSAGHGEAGTSLDSSSLVALNSALSAAEADRIGAEQRYRQGQTAASGEIQRDTGIQTLRTERSKLQADYDQKLTLYRPEFPAMVQLRAQIAAVDSQLRAQSTGIGQSLRSDYEAAIGREKALRARVAQLRGSVLDTRERSIQYNFLQREADTNRVLYDALLQRYKEIGLASGVGATSVSVVDSAEVPGGPFQPKMFQNIMFGLFGGLALGIGLAYLIEFIDDTVKAPEDVKSKLHVPVLGVVPLAPKNETIAEQLSDPQSPVSEAYFSISAAIQFSTSGGSPRSVLVSSSQPAEGKSSSCYAIAQNFARLDRTVLLIDADMRKPSFFLEETEKTATIGLSALLTSESSLISHVSATRSANLFLLPSGRVPPNPAELLSSHRMQAILEEALSRFDMVIIDAPPVLGLADAPILASMCQATILVVQSGAIRRPAVINTIQRLRSTGGHVTGAILTKFNPKTSSYGYGYGYGSGYGYGYGYGRGAYKYGVSDTSKNAGRRRIQLS